MSESIFEIFAARVREGCIKKGITLQDLVEATGIKEGFLNGSQDIDLESLAVVANVLGVKPFLLTLPHDYTFTAIT